MCVFVCVRVATTGGEVACGRALGVVDGVLVLSLARMLLEMVSELQAGVAKVCELVIVAPLTALTCTSTYPLQDVGLLSGRAELS